MLHTVPWLTHAQLSWFDDGGNDAAYLLRWRDVPRNYRPGQPVDASWYHDSHQKTMATAASSALFRRAGDLLLRYRFYPTDVMQHVSDFSLAGRRLRVGDRIVQRIPLLRPFGRPLLAVLGMTEIAAVEEEPRRVGFTYVTTAVHAAQGEWSVAVDWLPNDDVALTLHAVSRPSPQEPWRNRPLMRALQKRAHRRGMAHFAALVNRAA